MPEKIFPRKSIFIYFFTTILIKKSKTPDPKKTFNIKSRKSIFKTPHYYRICKRLLNGFREFNIYFKGNFEHSKHYCTLTEITTEY